MKLKQLFIIIFSLMLLIACVMENKSADVKILVEWKKLDECKRYIPYFTDKLIIELYNEKYEEAIETIEVLKEKESDQIVEISNLDIGNYNIYIYAENALGERLAKSEMNNVNLKRGENYLELILETIIPVKNIMINEDNQVIKLGELGTLSATVIPGNASEKKIYWESSNTEIATVSDLGVIVSKALGETTIKVLAEGKVFDVVNVLVVENKILLDKLEIIEGDRSISVDENFTFTVNFTPSDATNKHVVWSSSNNLIATVNEFGIVEGKSSGSSLITVIGDDGIQDHITLIVTDPTEVQGLEILSNDIEIGIDKSKTVLAQLIPSSIINKQITWESSNTSILTVDVLNGLIKGISLGEATLYARSEGYSDSIKVKVISEVIEVESVTINENIYSLNLGESITVSAIVLPDNASDKTITWSSSNETVLSILKIDETRALITALSSGSSEIKASIDSINDKITIIVEETNVDSIQIVGASSGDILDLNSELQLTAVILPIGTIASVNWSTSNSLIATVLSDGKVTSIAEGNLVVTVESGGLNDSINLQIGSSQVSSIEIIEEDIEIFKDNTKQLTVALSPDIFIEPLIIWSSEDEGIAIVDQTGLVTGKSSGITNIKAEYRGIQTSVEVKISNLVASINIEGPSKIYVDEKLEYVINVIPSDAIYSNAVWTLKNKDDDDDEIAELDSLNNLEALEEGDIELKVSLLSGGETITGKLDIKIYADTGIIFDDLSLENVVRNASGYSGLSSGEILRSDVLGITVLNAKQKSINSLNGIRALSNLENLDISKNEISDLSDLRYLSKIKILDLEDVGIETIDVISNLNDLEELYLKDNQISDILVLSNKIKLKILDFENNSINDISVFNSSMVELTEINIVNNLLADISSFKDIPNLEYLNIQNNDKLYSNQSTATLTAEIQLIVNELTANGVSDLIY